MSALAPALVGLVAALAAAPAGQGPAWRTLADGVEYATLPLDAKPAIGDGLLHVVRIDPAKAHIDAGVASEAGGARKTAGQWADAEGFVVAINAGMFLIDDGVTHEGYLRHGTHVDQKHWKGAYKSVLGVWKGRAAVADCANACPTFDDAALVAQNLRLIAGGKGVWAENGRRWSEAAVAEDDQGRLLFLFSRTPLSMAEWNRRVLALPLGVVRAMHAEGGPEASLSIRAPGLKLDLCGSYETGFVENDDNHRQWPIPNVLGVR